MSENIRELKSQIQELKRLLDLSYYCKDDENRKKLAEEFDRLSYKYYKNYMEHLRSWEGDGDGI